MMTQLELRVQPHQKSTTTSQSSKQIKKKQKTINCLSLLRNVQTLIKKNENKYSTIIKQNPQFQMNLYKPSAALLPQKLSAINQQILLKQLDNLMDNECILDKQLNKINFQIQQTQEIRQLQTQNHIDHYLFLRSVWTKDVQIAPENQDRLQNLNKKVGFIKGHIKSLIAQQEKQQSCSQIKKIITETDEYRKLKQKYQRLLMCQQDQKMFIDAQINKKQQKSTIIIQKLQKENQSIITKYFEQRQKNKKLQKQIVQLNIKLQKTQKTILDKDVQLSKFNRQSKYIYKNAQQFSLILLSKNIFQHKSIAINKTFNQIHSFLTSPIQEIQKQIQTKNSQLSRITKKISQSEFNPDRMKKLYLQINEQKQNQKKVRHIKGINDLKSVDMKRPKFIRSNTFLDDSNTKFSTDQSSKRN